MNPNSPDQTVIAQMLQHLQGMDYSFERSPSAFRLSHDEEFDFLINEVAGGVKFRIFFQLKENAAPPLIIKVTNDLNRETVVAKFYLDADSDFVVDAWFPLTYEVKAFDAFVRAWHHDMGVLTESDQVGHVLA